MIATVTDSKDIIGLTGGVSKEGFYNTRILHGVRSSAAGFGWENLSLWPGHHQKLKPWKGSGALL